MDADCCDHCDLPAPPRSMGDREVVARHQGREAAIRAIAERASRSRSTALVTLDLLQRGVSGDGKAISCTVHPASASRRAAALREVLGSRTSSVLAH